MSKKRSEGHPILLSQVPTDDDLSSGTSHSRWFHHPIFADSDFYCPHNNHCPGLHLNLHLHLHLHLNLNLNPSLSMDLASQSTNQPAIGSMHGGYSTRQA